MIDDEGWVVQNLRAFGNSLVPAELIQEYGIARVETMIQRCSGLVVRIRYVDLPAVYDQLKGRPVPGSRLERVYIADVQS